MNRGRALVLKQPLISSIRTIRALDPKGTLINFHVETEREEVLT